MNAMLHRALWIVALVPAVVVALVGCAPKSQVKPGEASSPTGGVAMIFEERNLAAMSFRRYELDPDGTLRVGGGKSAQSGKTDWSGTPDPADLKAILSAIRAAGLLHATVVCEPRLVDDKESIRTNIDYAAPDGSCKLELEGYCPVILPIRAAFEKAATTRFKPQLDALPEPGVQRKRPVSVQ
ncbi:MAG: hypothetical protein U0572_17160 [Phycisphaerales bacterium]